MALVVAYHVPHNDGVESGVITESGFDSGTSLVDLYEVDATIRSFDSEDEACVWLNGLLAEDD